MSLRRFLLPVATGLLAACAIHSRPAPGARAEEGLLYPSGEAAAVYRTVLDTLYGLVERPPVIILYDSTQGRVSDCDKSGCHLVPPHKTLIERSTLRDFDRVTARPPRVPLRADFGYRTPILLVGDKDQEELTRLGEQIQASVKARPDEMPFWVGMLRRYPGTWGRTVLTAVGFNTRKTQALIQVFHNCAGSCMSIEDMVLTKRNGRWEVVERIPLKEYTHEWIKVITLHGRDSADEYRVLASPRYLGPNPRMRTGFFAREDSIRKAIADSLALERKPTRIRGTVVNLMTGLPLARAVVISHSAPGNVMHRVTADSAGEFVLENLRNGTMLEVRCPGLADKKGATLAAPSFYAHAAIDTVVRITVPDLMPCWAATPARRFRVHRLQSGWAESLEARSATYPAGNAERVYHAVLDVVNGVRRGTLVLKNRTATQCVIYNECGGPQLTRLIAQGIIDSATARDFIRSNRDTVAIRPAFQHRGRTLLMTSSDSAFLIRQSLSWMQNVDANPDMFWNNFRQAYPDARGIVSLTRVGFNADSTQALVEAHLDTAFNPRRVFEMLLLDKTAGKWRVSRRHIEREATSGAFRGGKCVPVTAPRTRPDPKRIAAIQGDFLLTEVTTSRLSPERRVRIHLPTRPSSGSSIVLSRSGFDGPFKQISPLRIEDGAFFGTWHASWGNAIQLDSEMHMMPDPSGFFCAIRLSR